MEAKEPISQSAEGVQQAKGFVYEIWDWLKSILFALAIVMLIHTFIFNLSTVKGISMMPTLRDGEWLFVNKLEYRFFSPERGDVVILRNPDRILGTTHKYLVKRIIGLPGDTVEIRNQALYINGKRLKEAYVDSVIEDGDLGPMKVGKGEYFVMGDNRHRGDSMDSRNFGTVSKSLIEGEADCILWPLNQFRLL